MLATDKILTFWTHPTYANGKQKVWDWFTQNNYVIKHSALIHAIHEKAQLVGNGCLFHVTDRDRFVREMGNFHPYSNFSLPPFWSWQKNPGDFLPAVYTVRSWTICRKVLKAQHCIFGGCRRKCSTVIWPQAWVFWYKLWTDCDQPHNGAVADCMRCTRASYHYAIRHVRKNAEQIVRDRIAHSLLIDSSRNYFWSEIRKIRNAKKSKWLHCGWWNFWSGSRCRAKYRDLYSNVSYNVNDLQDLIDNVELENDIHSWHYVQWLYYHSQWCS